MNRELRPELPQAYSSFFFGMNYDWNTILKGVENVPCIYGIYINGGLVYIGCTNKLKDRMKRHFMSKTNKGLSDALLTNFFNFEVKVLDNDNSFQKERVLIKIHSPKYNQFNP